ncbi:thioredoxin domain-containing protein [Parvularcula flava]|uniref:Thioredoxin domain-containing protein n=1 Tax=Aquisalinus luteolus TaxID=1566827 RepID=A0A8J3A1R3_9PROT|nr:DsbA family protein [Aquisalinus luteolus]NHK27809.1 thioredoxin domain-containing protein [Aquisalinus luteolus]GGH96567.1 hypothetical protein GCM10011355_15770 [Aquisalinus luteolus]
MTYKTALLTAAAIVAAGALGYSLMSSGTAQQDIAGKDREAIEQIIREYLVENPQVVIDALDRYNELEALRAEAEAMAGLDVHLATLISSEDAYADGASVEDAKVYVVELFDYHCGFCKQATDYVYDLLAEEDDVRVVFRELPILREESDYAAMAALAARDQGKYRDLHFAMMNASGILTRERIAKIAADNGIDVEAMEDRIDEAEYTDVLGRTRNIAIDIGVTGTPAFVVASADGSYSRMIGGWQPETLSESIEEARKAGI